MSNWSFRPSFKRLSRALHTPALTPRLAREGGGYMNDCINPDKQTWADTEEAMAGFYLDLLKLKEAGRNLHDTNLDNCISQAFNGYSAVLTCFALYLEASARVS